MSHHGPFFNATATTEIYTALDEQTVVVSGTGAASIVLPQLDGMLKQLRASRQGILKQVESLG